MVIVAMVPDCQATITLPVIRNLKRDRKQQRGLNSASENILMPVRRAEIEDSDVVFDSHWQCLRLLRLNY